VIYAIVDYAIVDKVAIRLEFITALSADIKAKCPAFRRGIDNL